MFIDQEEQMTDQNYLSSNSIDHIKFKKILVVGAGGIGCELLKSLVQTGFKRIAIVDLDKIEKSNLNRQFLFDRNCVGNFKSHMARDSILKYKKYDKELQIDSYVGNIKDKSIFATEFFKQFDIILNALDNLDARTYINKICMNNKILLVNSGTEGYLGYVGTYVRELTPCYNCAPKNKKKAIPICSIRSKPERIEHCVAWAKSLFELLFTENTNGNLLEDYKVDSIPIKNFQNYFYFDIKKEKENENKTIIKIKEIDISRIVQYEFVDIYSDEIGKEYDEFNRNINSYDDDIGICSDLQKLILILIRSNERLSSYLIENKLNKFDKFEKENKDIVNFVFAATCLRSINFNINPETRFKIKEIAGNIIPAIASTNAIIAGIQTIEAVKALNGQFDLLKTVNYNKDKKIASIRSKDDYKNENCNVCSTSALRKNTNRLFIEFNFERFTLANLLSAIENEIKLKKLTISHKNNLIYENEEGLDEDEQDYYFSLKQRPIHSFNIRNKDELKITEDKIGLTLIVIEDEKLINGTYKISGEMEETWTVENAYENYEENTFIDEAFVKEDDKFHQDPKNEKENFSKMFIKRKRRAPMDSIQSSQENQFQTKDYNKKIKNENDFVMLDQDDNMIELD